MFHGIKFVPILFHPLLDTSLMLVAAKLMAMKLKISVVKFDGYNCFYSLYLALLTLQ
jgi:hypothetical protein